MKQELDEKGLKLGAPSVEVAGAIPAESIYSNTRIPVFSYTINYIFTVFMPTQIAMKATASTTIPAISNAITRILKAVQNSAIPNAKSAIPAIMLELARWFLLCLDRFLVMLKNAHLLHFRHLMYL